MLEGVNAGSCNDPQTLVQSPLPSQSLAAFQEPGPSFRVVVVQSFCEASQKLQT